jgi:hypothetical protein
MQTPFAFLDMQTPFAFFAPGVGAAGIRAVRPSKEVRRLLGRSIRAFGIVCRCTELWTLSYCLGICTMLEKVSHNLVVHLLRCNHEGRVASYNCFVHVRTEIIDQPLHDSQVSHLGGDIQGRATILRTSIDVSAEILGQRAHESQETILRCGKQGGAAILIS